MKTLNMLILVMLLAYGHTILGQKTLDTIKANSHLNVALFFPSTIKQAITGNKNVVFSYNREAAQYFGLLQATPGPESNLLVVTMDGQVYDFMVEFGENLSQTHFFVDIANSIGPIHPLPDKKENSKTVLPTHLSFLWQLLSSDDGSWSSIRRKGIRLRLKRMVYHEDQVLMVVDVRNRSDIDFNIGTLEVLRVNGNSKKRSSYQETRLEPHYIFEQPKVIKAGMANRFVIAFPKFVLTHEEHLRFVILETNGSRRLTVNF